MSIFIRSFIEFYFLDYSATSVGVKALSYSMLLLDFWQMEVLIELIIVFICLWT